MLIFLFGLMTGIIGIVAYAILTQDLTLTIFTNNVSGSSFLLDHPARVKLFLVMYVVAILTITPAGNWLLKRLFK